MVEYKCLCCNFKSKIKTHYKRHLETNKHKNREKHTQTTNDHQPTTKRPPNDHQKPPIFSPNFNNNNNINKDEIICKYCNKVFNQNKSLLRHLNELRCKKIPNEQAKILKDSLQNKAILKRKEKEEKCDIINNSTINNNNNINNTTNNTNNTNNTNTNNNINNNINNGTIINNNLTVKINPLGQEDISFLTKEDKLKILSKCYMGVPELIKKIHNKPENHNLFIHNIKEKIMCYLNDDNEIEYDNYNKICEKVIEDNIQRLDDIFNEYKQQMKNNIKDRLIKVLENNNLGTLNDKYIEDIRFYLLKISKKNKKEINEYMAKLDKTVKEIIL